MFRGTFLQFLGWVGALGLLVSYILTSTGTAMTTSVSVSLINILGGILVAVAASARKSWQPMLLNIVWALFGLFALIRAAL